MGAPSFSLASSKTTCSSELFTQDTSFQRRTAESKKLSVSVSLSYDIRFFFL